MKNAVAQIAPKNVAAVVAALAAVSLFLGNVVPVAAYEQALPEIGRNVVECNVNENENARDLQNNACLDVRADERWNDCKKVRGENWRQEWNAEQARGANYCEKQCDKACQQAERANNIVVDRIAWNKPCGRFMPDLAC